MLEGIKLPDFMEEDDTLFEAMQAFDALSGVVVFTANEIALFYAILYSWNAARRPAVIQQWVDTTCTKCALEKKHAFPNARNGLVQKGVLFYQKKGNRGVPHYSLNALFGKPNPILLPYKGSKDGSIKGSKCGVNTGVKADSYQEKEKSKDKIPIIPSREQAIAYSDTPTPVPVTQECACAWFETMEERGWVTKEGIPIANWQASLRKFASYWNQNRTGFTTKLSERKQPSFSDEF